MSETPLPFRRYLKPDFVEALDSLVESPQGQWWQEILAHPDLKLAIRTNAIDVYNSGSSIFRIVLQENRVVARTHFKYLVRQRDAYASICPDGKTFYRDTKAEFWPAYEGLDTLNEMIAAAKPFAGPEKSGLHPLILAPSVVDLEVAFWSVADNEAVPPHPDYDETDAGPERTTALARNAKHRHDRLDAATLEERDGDLWIVFHEAKHFTNPELRSGPTKEPRVIAQIERYRKLVRQRESDIARTYGDVSRALCHLHKMRAKADPTGVAAAKHWDRLIKQAADGDTLHVDTEPRLIVFGFDNDQKEGAWKRERQRLEREGLTVYSIGDPKTGKAAAAFRRQEKKRSYVLPPNESF